MFIKRPVIAGVGPGSQWGTAERKPRRQVTTIETRAEKERKKRRKEREREREREIAVYSIFKRNGPVLV